MSKNYELIINNGKHPCSPGKVKLPIYLEKPPEHPNSRKNRIAGYSVRYFVCY